MFTIAGKGHRTCDGVSRRGFLTIGAAGLGGVTLADLARVEERYPLNSRIAMTGTGPVEEVYRIGGRYGATLAKVAAVAGEEPQIALKAVAPPTVAMASPPGIWPTNL